MKKKRSQIVASRVTKILSIVIVVVMALNLVYPDRQRSDVENRSLQAFPEFTMENLMNGKYAQGVSTWFSDQFVGRDTWVHAKYVLEKLMGTKKIDSVYLCGDRLIQEVSKPNQEQLQRNLDAINQFATNHDANVRFMLVPTSANIQKSYLPNNATTLDQNAQMDQIYGSLNDKVQAIDVREPFKEKKNEELYYRSDHHWTSLASFYAYQQYVDQVFDSSASQSDYDIYTVSDKFEGTLAKKVGSFRIKDLIEIYVPKNNPDYLVINETAQTKSRSLYDSSALDTSNPYDVFLSGNSGLIQIETNVDSDRHLLLFKDSYANSFIPFLLPQYRTITVVDPRYYYEDVERLYMLNLITDVLFLYNANTFVEDTSLADVIMQSE